MGVSVYGFSVQVGQGGVPRGWGCLPRWWGCLPRGCLPKGVCLLGVYTTHRPVNKMTDRQV